MQKFTRSLTREIEVGGERVAVTLDEHGVTMRPVGARRPPHTISWTSIVCAATTKHDAPSAEHLAEAVKSLKHGAEKEPAASNAPAPEAAPHTAPAHHETPPPPTSEHPAHEPMPEHPAHEPMPEHPTHEMSGAAHSHPQES